MFRTRGTCPTCGPFILPIPSITLHVNDLTPQASHADYTCDAGHPITIPLRPDRRDHIALIRRYHFLGARLERIDAATVENAVLDLRGWLHGEQFDAARARLRLAPPTGGEAE